MRSVKSGDLEFVIKFLEQFAFSKDSIQRALITAIHFGHLKIVEYFVINNLMTCDWNVLLYASSQAHVDILRFIINLDVFDNRDFSECFMEAVRKGKISTAQFFASIVNPSQETLSVLFHLACKNGHAEAIKVLLSFENVDVNSCDANMWITNPRFILKPSVIKKIGSRGIDLMKDIDRKVGGKGHTILHKFALASHMNNKHFGYEFNEKTIMMILNHRKCDINTMSGTGHHVIHSAPNNVKLLKLLLAHPDLDINARQASAMHPRITLLHQYALNIKSDKKSILTFDQVRLVLDHPNLVWMLQKMV